MINLNAGNPFEIGAAKRRERRASKGTERKTKIRKLG